MGLSRKNTVQVPGAPLTLDEGALQALARKLYDSHRSYQAAYKEVAGLATEFVAATCPFKIGDVTTIHSHTHNGKQMRVDKITAEIGEPDEADNSPVHWKVSGVVLRKSGSPSDYYAEMAQWEYEFAKRRQPLPPSGKIRL